MRLLLGESGFDVTHRALVMGILNRTRDSFFDHGTYWNFDAFLQKADELVTAGADILDVGGVKAGPGDYVGPTEELDRTTSAIEALRKRFDVPLSIDTWRAVVAEQAYAAGAVIGNDISGFSDIDYLPVAARAGATVIATHIRLRPRVADPDPRYDNLVADVAAFLRDRAQRALDHGIPAERIIVDAGLDLGKTWQQSLELLRHSKSHAELGFTMLLSASNKTFLGRLLGLEVPQRREASLVAAALAVEQGCRILRVHDVAGTCRVRDTMEQLMLARSAQNDDSRG